MSTSKVIDGDSPDGVNISGAQLTNHFKVDGPEQCGSKSLTASNSFISNLSQEHVNFITENGHNSRPYATISQRANFIVSDSILVRKDSPNGSFESNEYLGQNEPLLADHQLSQQILDPTRRIHVTRKASEVCVTNACTKDACAVNSFRSCSSVKSKSTARVDNVWSNNNDDNCSLEEEYLKSQKSIREQFMNKDANNNPVQWESTSKAKYLEHASYILHKDRRNQLIRTLNLLPVDREYVVFNVFTDLARYLGSWRGRGVKGNKKTVAFPEEVMEQYEQKGDVAGKDRFVPTAKEPYRGITPTKKRRLSAIYSTWSVKSSEFMPKIERIDNYTKMDHFCERKCLSSDCCMKSKKPDLTALMDGYLCDLNSASLFIHGHATRTYESAITTLEFLKLGVVRKASASPLATNYAKQHIGALTANVWIFGYAIRSIVQQASEAEASAGPSPEIPSESGFRKLLEQFAAMCLTVEDGVKVVLQHSHNFYNFCKECIRLLKIMQIHLQFKGEIKLKLPAKRGDGLDLDQRLKKRDIVKTKSVDIMVAKIRRNSNQQENEVEVPEWKPFKEVTAGEKMSSIRQLLEVTSDGMNLVQTQLRFLLDDIVDSVRDVTEADLLFILGDMYDRIKFLETAGNSKQTSNERGQIAPLMTEFCKDFQSFIDFGQHIMRRYIELRDIIHVCYEFLSKGLKLETLSEMVPPQTFKKKKSALCCGAQTRKKNIVAKFQPKYQPLDFFRVYFKEAVSDNAVIYANKYYIKLVPSNDIIKSIIPTSLQCQWGDIEEGTPRDSFDEYFEPDADDETQPADELPKPILISSPAASPRGSGSSVEGLHLATVPPPPTSPEA